MVVLNKLILLKAISHILFKVEYPKNTFGKKKIWKFDIERKIFCSYLIVPLNDSWKGVYSLKEVTLFLLLSKQ